MRLHAVMISFVSGVFGCFALKRFKKMNAVINFTS